MTTTTRLLRARNLRLRAELAAARAALHTDSLTGLSNRDGLAAAWPDLAGATLALIDLDNFKPVNDTFGRAAGDEVLRVVAGRIADDATVAGRMGGDEFAAVLPHAGVAYALAVAIADPIRLPAEVGWIEVRASVGITAADGDLSTALARADAAMYTAKRRGGGVAPYRPADDHIRAVADEAGARVRDLPARHLVVLPN